MTEIFMAGPDITEADIAIVNDMLRNGWYGASAYSYVERFEHDFAKWHDRKYALMTPNCTQAIHLLLAGMGITEGQEVIIPDITWIASAAPIKYQNAIPVFADVNEKSWCLDVESISKNLTNKTRAVIVVDLYGNLPDMMEIEDFCRKNNLYLIEDAAEALGSSIGTRRAGSFGDASVFSFHRTKTLTTGEGGMLLLDDEQLYERCKFLRDHGREKSGYFNMEVAFKYMPSNLAAALGFAQFQRVNELVTKKRDIWQTYKSLLSATQGVTLNPEPSGTKNSVWSTVLLVDPETGLNRDLLMEGFVKLGIPTRPFFYPLSSLPAFSGDLWRNTSHNEVANRLSQSGVCLPSALNLTSSQIEVVVHALQEILSQ